MPRTTPGSGALLRPYFNSDYGVEKIEVLEGGAGYAVTDPPKIEIDGTVTPTTEGVFFPVITGVGTIGSIVIFKEGIGYYPVFSTTTASDVVVERGAFGSIATSHTVSAANSVFTGDYNIKDDNIYFTDAPFGKLGPVGLETGSTFSGRLFSRKLDPFEPEDKNLVLDDIALEFTGLAGTQFTLTENLGIVTALYNDVNSGVDLNNNPFVLINNVVQTPGADFEVVNSSNNKLNFLSGVPRAGRIVKVGLQTGSGYYAPIKAAGVIGIGSTGAVEHIQLTGKGAGYRSSPETYIRSGQGSGAVITANLGTNAGSTVAITTADYNHIAGICTFTTGSAHNLEVDDRVRITGAGFTFTPLSANRNIAFFGYDYITGIASIRATAGHYLGTATNQSKSILVTQVQVTDGISTFLFREDGYPIVNNDNANEVRVFAGVGTQPLTYVSGGLVRSGIDTGIMEGRNIVGFDVLKTTANTFACFVGITTFQHNYVTGGVVEKAEAGIITSLTITNGGTGYYIPKTVSYINQTPSDGITTVTAHGSQVYDTHIYNGGNSTAAITITQGSVNKDVNGATYNPNSGELVLSIGSHSYTTSNTLKINAGKLSFTCSKDDHATSHTYPRTTDPVYNKTDIAITGVGATTITCNVGPAGGVNIASLTYDSVSGVATITPGSAHGLTATSVVRLSGIAFSTGIGDITFPSDVQRFYSVTGFAGTAFTVNIGAAMTTTGIHTAQAGIGSFIHFEGHGLKTDDFVQVTGTAVTFASSPAVPVSRVIYDNTSGIATVLTNKNHNLTEDDCVVLSGIAFTCDYEPRIGVSSAEYSNTTGVMTVTTAANHGYKVGKDIVLAGLGFTCQLDNGAKTHYYPRRKSSTYDTSVPILSITSNTITADVGYAAPQDQFSHTFKSALAGGVVLGGEYTHKFINANDGALLTGGAFDHKFITASAGALFNGGGYAHTHTSSQTDVIRIGGNYNHTFVSANADCVEIVGGGTTTPTTADYNASTGDLTLTVPNHGLSGPSAHTVTTSRYNAIVGIVTLTIPSHGFANGDKIKVLDNSIGFKCSMDGYGSTHTYPRSTDPISNEWMQISNKTTDTFEIFVGTSPLVNFTVTDAKYTPSVGIMTMTIGTHDLKAGTSIKIANSSLNFKCSMDGKTATKTYPRTTDPYYDTALSIVSVGATTIAVNVGVSTIVTQTPVFAHYTPSVGVLTCVLNTVNHGITVGDSVRFKELSLGFTCLKDANSTNHFYPRPGDPFHDTAVVVTGVAGTMFTCNVGLTTAGDYIHSFIPNQGITVDSVYTGGDYDHEFVGVSTDAVISGGVYDHTFESATSSGVLREVQKVKIAKGSVSFKCAKDNYATVHAYPRSSDPVFNTNIGITTQTTNTFTVRVGVSTIQNRSITTCGYDPLTGELVLNVGAGHSYTSQTSHTITDAVFTPSTGVLEPTIAGHGFVSGDYVNFGTGSVSFKCAEDNYATPHAYPRSSDPYANRWLSIYNVGINTFSVFVGVSSNTTTHQFFVGLANGLKKATDTVGINTGSISFTCARDAHATEHAYPRPSDPYGGNASIGIAATTANTITLNVGISTIESRNISTSTYTPSTGELVLTSPRISDNLQAASLHTVSSANYNGIVGIMTCTLNDHGFVNGDRVKFDKNSIEFRCSMDGKKSVHKYPRQSDPTMSKWLPIFGVTEDTFNVNVGVSTIVTYSPTAGSYDPNTGLMTVTIGSHTIKKGQGVKLKTRAFKFTCGQDNHATNHFYPRATAIGGPDPAYNTSVKVIATGSTTITLDVGTASNKSEHIFISSSADSIISGGAYDHEFFASKSNGLSKANGTVGITTNGLTFTCSQDDHSTNHTYPRTSDPVHNVELGIKTTTTNSVTIQVGVTTQVPINVTNASYAPATGIVELTTDTAHGLSNGLSVGIGTSSLNYTCAMDNHGSEHQYPRPGYAHTFVSATSGVIIDGGDYAHTFVSAAAALNAYTGGDYAHKFISADTDCVTSGSWSGTRKTPTYATYAASTGLLVLTFGSAHGLIAGTNTVGIATGGITFTCARDNYLTEHAYPRTTDPINSLTNVAIAATTPTTLTVNVGISTIVNLGVTTATYTASTGVFEMTVPAGHGLLAQQQATATAAIYNPVAGIMTVTSAGHGFVNGDRVKIVEGGITFKCAMDNNTTNHAYPRRTDPTFNKWLPITNATTDTFAIEVGKSPKVSFTPTNALYTPQTGIMTVTVGPHNLRPGTSVRLLQQGFIFKCAQDNYISVHSYPRANGQGGATGDDPALNAALGIKSVTAETFTIDVGVSTNLTTHLFENAANDAVTTGGDYAHTFVSATSNGIKKAVDTIGIATNSITMTCARDAHATQHTYPRPADPIHNIEVGIAATTATTITVSCGISTISYKTPTGAFYNGSNGDLELTLPGHDYVVGDNANIGIATSGLVFTCAIDGHATQHSYPRTTDPYHNKITTIKSVVPDKITVNVGESGLDDPAHNKKLTVASASANTLQVNVGTTTAVGYNISTANYSESLGIMTMTVGAGHSFTPGTNFKYLQGAITFTCDKDGHTQEHAYPKKGDPYFFGSKVNRVISNTQIETQVGVSTVVTHFIGGGTIQGAIIAPREFNNSISGSDYASGGTFVDKIISNKEFTCNVGISTCVHHYNRGGDLFEGKRVTSSTGIGYGGVDVLESIDNANFRTNLGLTTEFANFKRGGRIDKPIFLDIHEPDPYFNLPLEYTPGSTGIGTNAVAGLRVNVDGNIGEFDLIEEGVAYKVDDVLTVAGLSTDVRVGVLTEFQLKVVELENDDFSAFYMGQFILFDNIASFFNSTRRKFTLSVTVGGTTEILSLKTPPGSDMDITNNIFIYINDILQTPGESYIFKGSRVIFSEAPKANSKCSIFYFRGSKRDVETIEPPLTVKAGDEVQIKENKINLFDNDQFERTGKRIVASDVLETFAYDSIGIDTAPTAERPLTWEKQKRDKVVSGVLISKARPSLTAKVLPTTRIIRNIGQSDNVIWVNNAYPIFSDIDLLTQAERNVQIFEDYDISPGILTSMVSTSSSISSLTISYAGAGYQYLNTPVVSISNAQIERKDIIKDWRFDAISGVTDTVEWKAFTKEEPIVAVGSSARYINTKSGTFWERGSIGFGGTVTFTSCGIGWTYADPQDKYVVAAGEYGKIARSLGVGNSMSSWTPITLKEERQIPALNLTVIYDSTYAGTFNDVVYDGSRDTWVAVGVAGSIFTAVGVKSDTFFSKYSNTPQTLNAIVYAQSEYLAVGNGGAIIASNDGNIWSPKTSNTNYNLQDIIYDGNRFITVGDNGTIGVSSDKNYWQPWSQQQYNNAIHPATFDFKKLKYIDGLYIGISTVGSLYYSFDLVNWNARPVNHSNQIRDLVDTTFGESRGRRVLAVGTGTTQFYADPIINRATANANVTAGVITSITITDGGFGYRVGSSPPAIVEPDKTKREDVLSFRTKGDYGTIVGINTWLPGIGATTPPRLTFTLKSDFNDNTNLGYGYSSLNQLGINYSQLQKDDYFIVYDSPCVVGHALTGITTAIGGYSNYPANKVGIISAGDNLGGIFRVEQVTPGDTVSGLVTVTCAFQPGPNNNSDIQVGIGSTSILIDTFYGKYTWGQIYGYQNRGAGTPNEFFVNPDNGLTGLSTAAVVSRLKPLT